MCKYHNLPLPSMFITFFTKITRSHNHKACCKTLFFQKQEHFAEYSM